MVSIQDTDEGIPVQALQEMEAATEDPAGGGTEGDRKREGSFHDPKPVRGRVVHQCDPGFLRTTKVGSRVGPKAGVTPAPGEDVEGESENVEVVKELGDEKGEG